RPAYDPAEGSAVLREDLSGCVLAIDDLHACPAADTLLRAVVEHPPDAKILVATRTRPTFFEPPDVARGRVLELRLDGLDEASAAELLASRGASLDPGDVPRVIAATGGHPLALELFAASGLDAGAVETEQYVLDTVLEGLDEVYHRIESGDLATAAARLVDVGPAFAESARAGDLESGLLRVPRDSKLDSLLVETQMFLGKFADARAVLERIAASGTPAER